MTPYDTTPICPLPGLGHCVRERCNFWDEAEAECTSSCFDNYDPIDATSPRDQEDAGVLAFYEDYD